MGLDERGVEIRQDICCTYSIIPCLLPTYRQDQLIRIPAFFRMLASGRSSVLDST